MTTIFYISTEITKENNLLIVIVIDKYLIIANVVIAIVVSNGVFNNMCAVRRRANDFARMLNHRYIVLLFAR